jgi:hypothetical protein
MWYLHSHFVWFRLPVLSIWFLLSFAWRLTIESFQHGHPYPRKRKTPTVSPAKPGDYLFYLKTGENRRMYIVPIAWLYVALMMAVAEATSPIGTVLGAVITFLLYGVLPITLVVYVMGTPARRRAIKAQERAELAAARAAATSGGTPSAVAPDAHCEAATDAVTPVREET